MNEDLKKIKKLYGEKMMHLCREIFPTLLEQEGLLSKLMIDNFAASKFLYDDIIESGNIESFKNYIYSLVNIEKKEEIKVNKTPTELLEEAGYNLYECKTEEDIQRFKKYYKRGEELCTFHGGRLDRCHVFFAVKKNVDEIKRQDFNNPSRQDEYGTSVISIQFTRGNKNTLSIKNRYNHTVNNPDATYSNNLENIIKGLTESFEREYKLNINQNEKTGFELLRYVKANDGKYYKYNHEINNIYYCPNNIIIDNFEVKRLEPEKYIVLDYFILDLVNKRIMLYDESKNDSFIEGIKDIEKINITKKEGNKQIEIITKDKNQIVIEIDRTSQIVGYKNNELKEIGDSFLYHNESVTSISLPKLQQIGDCFLFNNTILTSLSLPNLVESGNDFLYFNVGITSLSLPKLQRARDDFLYWNIQLKDLDLPNLEEVGEDFLCSNEKLTNLDLPSLTKIGENFLYFNQVITTLNLPKLREIKCHFLYYAKNLGYVYLPSLSKGDKYQLQQRYNEIIFCTEEVYENVIKSIKKSNLNLSKSINKDKNEEKFNEEKKY